jgi:enoyl-CoA hydratase/carnithine racemase
MTPPDAQLIRYEVIDHIAIITLNRPDRLNAILPGMGDEYARLLLQADADPAVRAIVVTGAGRGFCSGADLTVLAEGREALNGYLDGQDARTVPSVALLIGTPVATAINGPCAGIGLVQALVCDVRFMARGAKLSTAYAKLGIPAEYGLSWLLPRMIGIEWSLDLLLSARRVGGEEAQRIGLVTRVCDDDMVLSEAQAYAGVLATGSSPRAMAAIRRQIWGDLSRGYTEANALWFEAMLRLNHPDNPDFAEGVNALIEKRAPRFASLPPDGELPPLPPFAPQ